MNILFKKENLQKIDYTYHKLVTYGTEKVHVAETVFKPQLLSHIFHALVCWMELSLHVFS